MLGDEVDGRARARWKDAVFAGGRGMSPTAASLAERAHHMFHLQRLLRGRDDGDRLSAHL